MTCDIELQRIDKSAARFSDSPVRGSSHRAALIAGLLFVLSVVTAGVAYSAYRDTHRRFTYVIVHGAYGGGWAFRDVDSMLTADGQKVFRPTLTGQGEKMHLANPTVDLNTHIADVVNLILFEDLHNVVLVGHSYGGMVITGVADRIPDRIKCIIYLDALLPVDGESADTADHGIMHHPRNVKLDAHGSMPTSAAEMKKSLPHDEPMPTGAYRTAIALKNTDLVRAIPSSFVLFVGNGKLAKDAKFYPFYLRAQSRGWHTETFASDHNAQWSHPRELADLLERLP
jgi:pimeloyl-ACP methyl ester carboxylesterase